MDLEKAIKMAEKEIAISENLTHPHKTDWCRALEVLVRVAKGKKP